MNTTVGTIPLEAVLTMLNSLSRHDRKWLATNLLKQVEADEKHEKLKFEEFLNKNESRSWKEEDDALLDSLLAKFSGDWGGDGTPSEIARELRQGEEMVRDVDVW